MQASQSIVDDIMSLSPQVLATQEERALRRRSEREDARRERLAQEIEALARVTRRPDMLRSRFPGQKMRERQALDPSCLERVVYGQPLPKRGLVGLAQACGFPIAYRHGRPMIDVARLFELEAAGV